MAQKQARSSRLGWLFQYNPDRFAGTRGPRGVLLLAILLSLFAILFRAVRANKTAKVDAAVTLRIQKIEEPRFSRLMHVVSWPGFPPQSRLIPPTLAGLLWICGARLEAAFQLMAWGTGGISFTVKRIMRRSRPIAVATDHGINVVPANIGGSSFPSGHVINYIGVYGFLAYLASTWIKPGIIRKPIVAALTGLLALVAPSRIYLGHHWLTDTMASWLLGSSYLIVLTNVYRWIRMRIIRG